MIIVTAKLYILSTEQRVKESYSLFLHWKEPINSIQFSKSNELKWHAQYLHTCGIMYDLMENAKLAKESYERALQIRKELQLKGYDMRKGIATLIMNIGLVKFSEMHVDEALSNFNESNEIAIEINDVHLQGYLLLNLGSVYFEKGDMDKAITCFEKSMVCFESIKSKFVLHTYNQLARTFIWSSQYEKAFKIIEKMDKLAPNHHITFYRKSIYYRVLGNLKLAEEFMQLCIEKIADLPNISNSIYYTDFAKLKIDLRKINEAKELIMKVLRMLEGENMYIGGMLFRYFNILQAFIQLGDIESANEIYLIIDKITFDEPNENAQYLKLYSKALNKKYSLRLHTKLASIDSFKELFNHEFNLDNLDVQAGFHLIELLVYEYETVENIEVLDELNYNVQKLSEKITKRQQPALVIETLFLQAKIAIITGYKNKAYDYLHEGLKLGKEKKLSLMELKVKKELERLMEIDENNKLDLNNLSIKEKVDLSQIKNYLKEAIKIARPG